MNKPLLLIVIMMISSLSVFAQDIEVVSTSPANGAVAVDQDSIVLEFNVPIVLESANLEESGFIFYLEPEDEVQFENATISEDGLRVTLYGQLTDDTDFLGILLGAVGASGETLRTPFIFQFTTADEAGQFTVSGALEGGDLDNLNGMVAVLTSDHPNFGLENDTTGTEDFQPTYAAVVDTTTGEYTISGVREGTYFPLAMNVFQLEFGGDTAAFPDLYFYDPNEDFTPDSIDVNTTNAPENELTDINLSYIDYSPISFSEAVAIAQSILSGLENDPVLMGGGTYFSYSNSDNFSQKQKYGWSQYNTTVPPSNPPFKSKSAVLTAQSGLNVFWEVYAYDAVKDSAVSIIATPFGAFPGGYFSEEDVDVPVDFSTIKPLPATFIDSDSAAAIIEQNGGAEFRQTFENIDPETQAAFWEVELTALHEYWNFEPDPTPEAPVMWKGYYYGSVYNYQTEEYTEDSLIVFLDIETGQVLMTTSIEEKTEMPSQVSLGQNYPNPFNPSTNIPFTLHQAANVKLAVYNLLGQKVTDVLNDVYPAGSHTVRWNAGALSSGVYFYRLETTGFTQTRKLLLLK